MGEMKIKIQGEEKVRSAHVLLLPYPTQGHINPMLEFGKRLVAQGLQVTIAVTRFIAKSTPLSEKTSSVRIQQISDGYDEGGFAAADNIKAYHDDFATAGSRTLADLIREESARGCAVSCVVYDSFLPWAVDVAKGMGLLAVALFTQSCAVNVVYYHVYSGRLAVPTPGPMVSVEGLPELGLADAPSFIAEPGPHAGCLELLIGQFINLEKADTIFVNTFYQLEAQEADLMASFFPVKTIGPTIPLRYLGFHEEQNVNYGFDLFTPENEAYGKWLDSQEEPGSVVYVSFGSMAELTVEQTKELAWGLVASGKKFLWVVRASEEGKLPEGFAVKAAGKGLVVRWCSQLEVLAHPTVGCFVTHCGWNSTLEALTLGVPMVGVPQWSDQPTNAKYIEEVWRTGVKARKDSKGVVRREEMSTCIREVMEGTRREEIKKNAQKWRRLAAEAVANGGSSDRNTRELVHQIIGNPCG